MGNPANHSMLLKPEEMENLRKDLGVPPAADFPNFETESTEGRWLSQVRRRLDGERASETDLRRRNLQNNKSAAANIPSRIEPTVRNVIARRLSTQVYFSQMIAMMNRIAVSSAESLDEKEKSLSTIAGRYVTISPDVATSTIHLAGVPASADGQSLSGRRHFKV